MEDATPIFNLQNDNVKKDPIHVMSYTDVLKNMQQETPKMVPQEPQPIQAPQQSVLYAPQQLQLNPPLLCTPPPTSVALKEHVDEDAKTFQNDMIVLLSVYVIVHMKSIQDWIQTKIPNLVNKETGAMSVLGLLMNGVLVILLWNLGKKMVFKYLKEL